MKPGRPSKKQKKQAKQESNAVEAMKVKFKVSKALQLIDKNSRTFQKIAQLLEVLPPTDSPNDAHLLVTRRIEKLKMRLNRRLIKLAKWADLPEHERQQVATPNPIRMNLMNASNNLYNRAATYPANAKVNFTQPIRFHQNNTAPVPPQVAQQLRPSVPLPARIAPQLPTPTVPLPASSGMPALPTPMSFPGISRAIPGGVQLPNYALLNKKMAENGQVSSNATIN